MADGDSVVPGEYQLRNPISYVRLSSYTSGANIQEFVGYTLTGATSGVIAQVIYAVEANDFEDATLYVSYISSGATSESGKFVGGELLESAGVNKITGTVGIAGTSKPVTTPPLGEGALFALESGSFFIDGMIVRADAQTIVASKYNTRFDAKIGFIVEEVAVTSNDDPSLLDNSQGSSNFASPGADRLQINLTLASIDPDEVVPNFVKLTSVVDGNILSTPGETVKWDWLYDILARRTYDESGDYLVKDFVIRTQEYYNTEDVDGLYNANDQGYYPYINGSEVGDPDLGMTLEEADGTYVVSMSTGKAYVKGYEVDLKGNTYLYGTKSRRTSFRSDTLTQITEGYNLTVTNTSGCPDFANISGDGSAHAFDSVILYRNFTDGFVGEAVSAGRPLNLGNKPWTTYHIIADGDIGSNPTGYTEIYKEANGAVVVSPSDIRRGDVIGDATVLAVTKVEPSPAGVITPRYLLPSEQVDNKNGFFGYNSSYSMGIMSSTFFTELGVVALDDASADWVVGDLATGEQSGAIGTIEAVSYTHLTLPTTVIV